MPRLPVVLISIALVACAPATPALIREPVPAAEGTAVPLGKAVEVGAVAVEPLRIIEDSRCPADVTCAWAGRLVIEANIAAYGWAEITRLELDEPYTTHATTLRLAAAKPDRASDTAIAPEDYRFTFEAR